MMPKRYELRRQIRSKRPVTLMKVMRVRRGMAATELGEKAGLVQGRISVIERRMGGVDKERAGKIAGALGLPLNLLFEYRYPKKQKMARMGRPQVKAYWARVEGTV